MLVVQGEYILQELEALVKLHKYRTLRKQYNPDREDEMVASEFEKFKEKAGLLPRLLRASCAFRSPSVWHVVSCDVLQRLHCHRASSEDSCTDGASTVLFIIHYSF